MTFSRPSRAKWALAPYVLTICWASAMSERGRTDEASQQPAGVSRSQQASSAQSVSATTAGPSVGEATIYVYRIGSMVGAVAHPAIFVNGNRLADLHNSNYVLARVTAGVAAVAATQNPEGDFLDRRGSRIRFPGRNRNLSSLPGCEGVPSLEFLRIWTMGDYTAVKLVDSMRCENSLREARARIAADLASPRPSDEVIKLCNPPVVKAGMSGRMVWSGGYDRGDVVSCGREIDGALAILNTTSPPIAPTRISIDAAAGKTYYVRWSVSSRGGTIKLVDEVTGAKDISKLRLRIKS